MSAKCRDRFQENSCFYECSPNIGPWMVKEPNSHRSERFRDVPLSPAVCNAWFNDCKDDYTCKDNWAVGWDWSSGTNVCPADKPCKKFSEIFTSATEMCETIYPDDFKVTTNGPTMVLWFLGDTNPNDAVAAYYATEMNLRCGAGKLIDNIVLTTLMAIISLAFFQY
uniref:Folate receptor gamma-like n=1 Tax=Phallusia mammillata TaxID=59560 RepID=A0A6F9DDT5_9ASCI|nr:folate receptor gamma-like [Phallusia mammillata]